MRSQKLINKSKAEKNDQASHTRSVQKKSSDPVKESYNPLENISCRIGDSGCAARHVSVIQRTGLFNSMNENARVQSLLGLQQEYGNRFVQRVIGQYRVQAKLRIGQPGDIYEQEADKVADQVMRMPEPGYEEKPIQTNPLSDQITRLIQRQYPEEKEEEEEREMEEEVIMPKQAGERQSKVAPTLETQVNSLKGGGQPLSPSVRNFFEPRFGYDFSQVRIHTDGRAARGARGVNAKAYTSGRDVVFATGQYRPETGEGRQLLAHELTHVVQQNGGNQRVQAQAHVASLGDLTARRIEFNNTTGTQTNPANSCPSCPVNLGVGVDGGARNGMEIIYTIGGTIPRGTEFDITRTVMATFWERIAGAWRRILSLPAGTRDDVTQADEWFIPNQRLLFVEDRPGLPGMNPRGVRLDGVTVAHNAIAFVAKLSFWEWVIARNRMLGVGWTRISQPTFTTWHSITSVALFSPFFGEFWLLVDTPTGDSNEIELGRIDVGGEIP